MKTFKMMLMNLIILNCFIPKLESLIFPTSDTIKWSPIQPDKINCNFNSYTNLQKTSKTLRGYFPILKNEYKIEGYMCESITLITRCEEGFFGGTDITYTKIYNELSEQECVEAIHRVKNGETMILNYPPSDCGWMATNYRQIKYTYAVKDELIFDPYSDAVISELFLTNKCQTNYCPTIYEHKAWMSDDYKKTLCIPDHLDTTIFYIVENDGKHIDFWSPDVNVVNGRNICIMDYCGKSGILFADGSWIGLDKEEISKQGQNINHFFFEMKLCDNGTKLSLIEKHHSTHVAEQSIFNRFLEMTCEKVKERIILQEGVSRVELQALNPTTLGIHNVYRLNNGSLEMGVSYYQDVEVTQPVSTNPVVIKTSTGKSLSWKYWLPDPIHGVVDGPNGFFLFEGKLQTSIDSITSFKSAISKSLKLKLQIKPPTVHENLQKYINTDNRDLLSTADRTSLSTTVADGLSSIGSSLSSGFQSILIWGLAILTFLILCIWLIPKIVTKRCFSKKSPIPFVVEYKPK